MADRPGRASRSRQKLAADSRPCLKLCIRSGNRHQGFWQPNVRSGQNLQDSQSAIPPCAGFGKTGVQRESRAQPAIAVSPLFRLLRAQMQLRRFAQKNDLHKAAGPAYNARLCGGRRIRFPQKLDRKILHAFTPCTAGFLRFKGQLAQLVEQRIENPRVRGSIPRLATRFPTPAPAGVFRFSLPRARRARTRWYDDPACAWLRGRISGRCSSNPEFPGSASAVAEPVAIRSPRPRRRR